MSNLAPDQMNPLFNNFALSAQVFFTGTWCRIAAFDGKDSVGHLHLLRSGCVSVKNRGADSIYVDQPSVLFTLGHASMHYSLQREPRLICCAPRSTLVAGWVVPYFSPCLQC